MALKSQSKKGAPPFRWLVESASNLSGRRYKMKLSCTIAYAVQATLELAHAEPNRPIACGKIAKRGKMPKRFLLQILRHLVKHKVLCSARGVGGGYYLARAPDKITLLDIVEAIEVPLPA